MSPGHQIQPITVHLTTQLQMAAKHHFEITFVHFWEFSLYLI